MIAIKLVDARRGLNIKCRELFKDEKIAEEIYRYLCDGIEECDDVEPEREVGEWIPVTERLPENEVTVLVVRKFLGIKDCPAKTYVETAEYCYGDWVANSDEYKIARSKHTDPLYWMPLPDPPKEE